MYKRQLYNNSMLIKIDKQIDHIEEQKRRLIVRELSFNSYYEFALERIPQIVAQEKIQFNIRDFAAILKQFYRGGELEMTLNSDLDVNLFDEQFIVFEIDKIKDDPVLFPICLLYTSDTRYGPAAENRKGHRGCQAVQLLLLCPVQGRDGNHGL